MRIFLDEFNGKISMFFHDAFICAVNMDLQLFESWLSYPIFISSADFRNFDKSFSLHGYHFLNQPRIFGTFDQVTIFKTGNIGPYPEVIARVNYKVYIMLWLKIDDIKIGLFGIAFQQIYSGFIGYRRIYPDGSLQGSPGQVQGFII